MSVCTDVYIYIFMDISTSVCNIGFSVCNQQSWVFDHVFYPTCVDFSVWHFQHGVG